MLKRNKSKVNAPVLRVPLPTWTVVRSRVQEQAKELRNFQDDRARKWEEKEAVLGHIQKTDIRAPRAEDTQVPAYLLLMNKPLCFCKHLYFSNSN